jgi:hypothetical protein
MMRGLEAGSVEAFYGKALTIEDLSWFPFLKLFDE